MKNPDEGLANLHTTYVASSGGGKTQAMAANIQSVKGKKRVLVWDTHGSFKGMVCKTLAEFGRALIQHDDSNDFSICYQGKGGQANFSIFTAMVLEFSRGDKITYVMIDEVADCTESIGKDRSGFGELLRGGRKFGLRIHSTAVSVAEVPNTVWRESKTKYIGQQDNVSDLKRCADALVDASNDDIQALEPLEFIVKRPDNSIENITVKYKKSPHRL